MTDWVRVKDKTTQHEFTIDRRNVSDAVKVLDDDAGPSLPTPHVSPKKAKAGSSPAPATRESDTTGETGNNKEGSK